MSALSVSPGNGVNDVLDRPTATVQVIIRVIMSIAFQILTFPLLHMSNMPRFFETFDTRTCDWLLFSVV